MSAPSANGANGDLVQGFKPRHETMLSIAGIIGTGLFVGSGHAIAAGAIALLLYLAIAVSQLRMRGILRRRNHQLVFRMWLCPWLTWLVIGIISFILAVMFIMPTHRVEVSSTLALTVIIILLSQTGRRSSHSRPVPVRRAVRG
ncbi:hypothetical protein [Pseudomonas sp. Pseusp97]|uniref:hypothetical protein n=1 Tax=Pseudomonas sp. Pseusp97 TaxID=3243065 RepID=UPI0039A6DB0F